MDNDDAIDGYNKRWTNIGTIATIRQEVGLTYRGVHRILKRGERKGRL